MQWVANAITQVSRLRTKKTNETYGVNVIPIQSGRFGKLK